MVNLSLGLNILIPVTPSGLSLILLAEELKVKDARFRSKDCSVFCFWVYDSESWASTPESLTATSEDLSLKVQRAPLTTCDPYPVYKQQRCLVMLSSVIPNSIPLFMLEVN